MWLGYPHWHSLFAQSLVLTVTSTIRSAPSPAYVSSRARHVMLPGGLYWQANAHGWGEVNNLKQLLVRSEVAARLRLEFSSALVRPLEK